MTTWISSFIQLFIYRFTQVSGLKKGERKVIFLYLPTHQEKKTFSFSYVTNSFRYYCKTGKYCITHHNIHRRYKVTNARSFSLSLAVITVEICEWDLIKANICVFNQNRFCYSFFKTLRKHFPHTKDDEVTIKKFHSCVHRKKLYKKELNCCLVQIKFRVLRKQWMALMMNFADRHWKSFFKNIKLKVTYWIMRWNFMV